MNPTELESDSYDVVVIGTGLGESITAAALAKAGKTVLHLDPNEYYGSDEASLTLDELMTYFSSLPSSSKASWSPMTLSKELESDRRRYSLSLSPTVLPSRGSLIETLIASDVSKYVSFRMLDSVSLWREGSSEPGPSAQSPPGIQADSAGAGNLRRVPGSKEAVFKDPSITLADKRRLMKFLMFAGGDFEDDELLQGKEEQHLLDFLQQSFSLSTGLAESIAYAIAHCASPQEPTLAALQRTRRYLQSVGRYGSGAFLLGQYGGAGEVAQGFCRACAVFGGTYVLGPSAKVSDLSFENEKVKMTIPCHPRPVTATHLVASKGHLPITDTAQQNQGDGSFIASCIAIISSLPQPFKRSESAKAVGEGVEEDDTALVVFPPEGGRGVVRALLTGEGTGSCPPGQFILYLEAFLPQDSDPAEALRPYLSRLAPDPLFASYRLSPSHSSSNTTFSSSTGPSLVLLDRYAGSQGVTESLDWDAAQARAAYERIRGSNQDMREFFEKGEDEVAEEEI